MCGGLVQVGSCEHGLWKGRGADGVLWLPNFSHVIVKPSTSEASFAGRTSSTVHARPRFLRINSWYLCVTQTSLLVSTCVRVS